MSRSRKHKKPIAMPALDAQAIGRRIRESRHRHGRDWTMRDLSRVSGIPYGTLSAYEPGHRLPVRDNCVRLALALGITVDYLLLGRRGGRPKK